MKITLGRMVKFPTFKDSRGILSVCEANKHVPFPVKRIFWIYDTGDRAPRGHHAHERSWQAHVCLGGFAQMKLFNGRSRRIVMLRDPSVGLIIPPMVWHSFTLHRGASLVVMTSNHHSERDYVRDYDEFLRLTRR